MERQAATIFGFLMLVCCTAAITPVSARPRAPVPREPGLFQHLAGRWAGIGHAGLAGARAEAVRCSVDFTPAGDSRLHVVLRCASPTYRVQVNGDLSRDGERVAGVLTEATYGVPGKLYGIEGPGGLQGIVSGMGVSASMFVTLHGNVQSVTLQGLGSLKASAAVTLRRV